MLLWTDGALVIDGDVSSHTSTFDESLCPSSSNAVAVAPSGALSMSPKPVFPDVGVFCNVPTVSDMLGLPFKILMWSNEGTLSGSAGGGSVVSGSQIMWCSSTLLNITQTGTLVTTGACCDADTGFGAGAADSSAGGGGGHGGVGGNGVATGGGGGTGGATYGNATFPQECGSGGGSGGGTGSDNGGKGGGVIVLQSGLLMDISGTIDASGGQPTTSGGGGGSGGSIIVQTKFLAGGPLGKVSADGASGTAPQGAGGGAGGGGRIHLNIFGEHAEKIGQNFSGTVSVEGGTGAGTAANGAPGTVTGLDCGPGFTGSLCEPCPRGTYKPDSGIQNCTLCPAGRASTATGSSSCQVCAPGHFQNLKGQSNCSKCAPGQFQAQTEQTACDKCGSIPSKSHYYTEGETSKDCSYRCFENYAGYNCTPCYAWEMGGYNPCSFDPAFVGQPYPYGTDCSSSCSAQVKAPNGSCPQDASNYVCGGNSDGVPNGLCIGGGEDPRSFSVAQNQPNYSCSNVTSAASGSGKCGTCACVSAGFVAPFCVSELDMIIHTFGGLIGWFLMAIVGCAFVIGLAIVGICQCARARQKKDKNHRMLMQGSRLSTNRRDAGRDRDGDGEYHSLHHASAGLDNPLLKTRVETRGRGLAHGVENHLVRIYLEGRNTISSPLYLSTYPPPELAMIIDRAEYQEFATNLNSFAQFSEKQKAIYYFWCVAFYPMAVIYLQRLRHEIVQSMQKFIGNYTHEFFSHFKVQQLQESLRGFHSLDCTVFYVEVYHNKDAGTGLPPSPAVVGPKSRTVVKLAGEGNYFFPYFVDPNDVLLKAVHCMPGLEKMLSKEWPDVVQALNNALRVVDQADLQHTVPLAIELLRKDSRLRDLEGLDINLVVLRPTSFDAVAVPRSSLQDLDKLEDPHDTTNAEDLAPHDDFVVVDAVAYRHFLGLSLSSRHFEVPHGDEGGDDDLVDDGFIPTMVRVDSTGTDDGVPVSTTPASYRRGGWSKDREWQGGGLDAHGYVRSGSSLAQNSLLRQSSFGRSFPGRGMGTGRQADAAGSIGNSYTPSPASPSVGSMGDYSARMNRNRHRPNGAVGSGNVDGFLQNVLGSAETVGSSSHPRGRRRLRSQEASGLEERRPRHNHPEPSQDRSFVCRRYDVHYLTYNPGVAAAAKAELAYGGGSAAHYSFSSMDALSFGPRDSMRPTDVHQLMHAHEPQSCGFHIMPTPIETSPFGRDSFEFTRNDSFALVFSRRAATSDGTGSRQPSLSSASASFPIPQRGTVDSSTGTHKNHQQQQHRDAREVLHRLNQRRLGKPGQNHRLVGFHSIEDNDDDDDDDDEYALGNSGTLRGSNVTTSVERRDRDPRGSMAKRYSSIREEFLGGGEKNWADGNPAEKPPRDSGNGSLLGPDSPLDSSPALQQHEKQRRQTMASRRFLANGTPNSGGARDDADNGDQWRQQGFANPSLLGSALHLNPHTANFESAEVSPNVGVEEGGSRKPKLKDRPPTLQAANVTVYHERDSWRCLSCLRRTVLRNVRLESVGPGGVVEQIIVVLFCVLDVVESVVNASYLISPASTNGWQISGAFYFFILVWPFMVAVDPFFTFFATVYAKNRDARYASVVTMYSCINIIVAMAVLLIPLAVNGRHVALAGIFASAGSWPFFVLFPVCTFVLFDMFVLLLNATSFL